MNSFFSMKESEESRTQQSEQDNDRYRFEDDVTMEIKLLVINHNYYRLLSGHT